MHANSSTMEGRGPRFARVLDPRAPGLTLLDAFRIYTRMPSVRLYAGLLVPTVIARFVIGGFGWWDLALVGAMIAIYPFLEWVIHVGVLHWRPRRLGRWTIDWEYAREHRAHHEEPHNPRYWPIPMRSGFLTYLVVFAVSWLVMPTVGLWLSFLMLVTVTTLVYEWTHYLCHTSYRPRGRLYRALWKHHRFHHFKNEHYWMGVMTRMGDRILGTLPRQPRDVETSPTCRDLLGREEAA